MNERAPARLQASPLLPTVTPAWSSLLQRKCACGGTPGLGGECVGCRKKRLQRRSVLEDRSPAVPPVVEEALGSPGRPLDPEMRLGHDFSQVRVHAAAPYRVQTKLTVNQPGDKYEREADEVSEQVMRMADAPEVCRRPQPLVQAKGAAVHTSEIDPQIEANIRSLQGGGQTLPDSVRHFFEPRFAHDFNRVRIHTDSRANDMARAVNAQAFTTGLDIVFGAGQYAPGSTAGQWLMAHELVHVVQQVPHIARKNGEVQCVSGHAEGQGERLKSTNEYTYRIWGVWRDGDDVQKFYRRTFSRWIPWRFGNLAPELRAQMLEYMMAQNIMPYGGVSTQPGCQYYIRMDQNLMTRLRVMSGEVAREKEAKKASEAAAKDAPDEKQVAPEGAGTGKAGIVDSKAKEPAKGGPGLGAIKGPVEEEQRLSKEPISPVQQDWEVLKDKQLADHYLKVLEHYAGRSISTQDTAAAADGLSGAELEGIIDNKPLRRILTALYTQGYREFQRAKGTKADDFFKLEETIAEQFVRGNPTATRNNLMIGYGIPEENVLGIVDRRNRYLLYNADGQPLPALGGVGMRDKGYIGSRQDDDGFKLNIALIKDEGLRALLNSLRQTFSDPTRMSKEAAEIYFQNTELVNAEVQKGLPKEVWQKFQEMLPYFIGFLTGHALSTFLMRVPNPMVAGVGLALKGLLTAAGYVMQIDFAPGALQQLLEAARHLTRVEKDERGQLTKLSRGHLEAAAKPIRSMVADIALMFATMALARLLRGAKSGERSARIECTKCNIKPKGEPVKESAPPKEPAAPKEPPAATRERGKAILEEFAEGQGKATQKALEADIKSQPTIGEATKPGGAPQPQKFDVGNFSHTYAEQLIPRSKLPRGLDKEFKIPEAARRIDRVDWQNGKLYEIKPDTPSQIKAGEAQIKLYKLYMDKYYPLSGGRKWQGEVVTYDRPAVIKLLTKIGWLE